MAQLGGTFDPNQHEKQEAFDPLPAGWYMTQIVTADIQRTQDNLNSLVYLEFELLEQYHPQHKGRKIFARLCLWHSNELTAKIANGQLAKICDAVGLGPITDTDALLNKQVAVKAKIRAAKGDYEASNEPTGYDAIAARSGQGVPTGRTQNTPMGGPPPAQSVAPVQPPPATAPMATPAQPPPQGQPGEAQAPPWKK